MSLITLLVVLVVVGVLLYLLNTLVPMDPRFRTAINVIIGLLAFIYILKAFGLFGGGSVLGSVEIDNIYTIKKLMS